MLYRHEQQQRIVPAPNETNGPPSGQSLDLARVKNSLQTHRIYLCSKNLIRTFWVMARKKSWAPRVDTRTKRDSLPRKKTRTG